MVHCWQVIVALWKQSNYSTTLAVAIMRMLRIEYILIMYYDLRLPRAGSTCSRSYQVARYLLMESECLMFA